MRTEVANLSADEARRFPYIFGAAMDWPFEDGVMTVIASCDGETSICSGLNASIADGVEPRKVRGAAKRFVKASHEFVDEAVEAQDFTHSEADKVKFYILSYDGPRVMQADAEAIRSRKHRLHPLYAAAQKVISELRLGGEKQAVQILVGNHELDGG